MEGEDEVTVRVLLVDDQPLLRTGFKLILEAETDIAVVGEAGDGATAVDLTRSLLPDVVLMDIRMPGVDGIEATRRIVRERAAEAGSAGVIRHDPKVLILTTFDLDEYVVEAVRAGASGFLLKDSPPEELVAAIRIVAHGDAIVAPSVTRRLLDRFATRLPAVRDSAPPPGLDTLTGREREVLSHVARGLSNAEIAAELVVSETTVKTHVGNVLAKLGLRDRVQAVVYAYETGLAQPGHN